MFENEHDFKRVVAGLKVDTTPNLAHKERLRRQVLATFKTAGPDLNPKPAQLGVRTVLKLAVAAAIVVTATIGVHQFGHREAMPSMLEPVRLATHEMPWLHATVTEYLDEGDRTEEQWNNSVSKVTYIQASSGFVFCSEYGDAPRHLVYNPRARSVIVKKLPPAGFFGAQSAYTLIDAATVLASNGQDAVRVWDDFHECRAVQMYELQKADPGIRFRGQIVGLLRIKLITDPETKRLVAAHVEYEDHDKLVLARQDWIVRYPASGPQSIYDLGVPRTARIIDATAQPVGTPADLPRPISTPAQADRS